MLIVCHESADRGPNSTVAQMNTLFKDSRNASCGRSLQPAWVINRVADTNPPCPVEAESRR
jgi:hypothetical protein